VGPFVGVGSGRQSRARWVPTSRRRHRAMAEQRATSILSLLLMCFVLCEYGRTFSPYYATLSSTRKCSRASEERTLGHTLLSTVPSDGFEDVDFDEETLKRVYHPGDLCRLRHLLETCDFSGAEPFEIVIIGGSVPFGSEMAGEARYSEVMKNWISGANDAKARINSTLCEVPVAITNIAQGGCGTLCWLSKISPQTTPELYTSHLVIVDLSVNDQNSSPSEIQSQHFSLIKILRSLPQRPEIAFIEELRLAKNVRHDMEGHCSDEDRNEVNGYFYCGRWWDMQTHAEPVLRWSNISFISYRDGFWPVKFDPPNSMTRYWNGLSHPDARGHRLLAKTVLYLVANLMIDAMENNFYYTCRKSDQVLTIDEPVFAYDWSISRGGVSSKFNDSGLGIEPDTISSEWLYEEWSRKKFGWVLNVTSEKFAHSCDAAQLSLPFTTISFTLPQKLPQKLVCGNKFELTYIRGHASSWGTAVAALVTDDKSELSFDLVARMPELLQTTPHTELINLPGCTKSVKLNISLSMSSYCERLNETSGALSVKFVLLGSRLS